METVNKPLTVCKSRLKSIRVINPTIMATGAKLLIAKNFPIVSPVKKKKEYAFYKY